MTDRYYCQSCGYMGYFMMPRDSCGECGKSPIWTPGEAFELGFITRDEARKSMGLPSLPAGAVPWVVNIPVELTEDQKRRLTDLLVLEANEIVQGFLAEEGVSCGH